MAYRDPYYNTQNQNQQFQQQYTDGPEFDPYNTHQPHASYDQGGYTDDEAFPAARGAAMGPRAGAGGMDGLGKEANAYQDAPFRPPG